MILWILAVNKINIWFVLVLFWSLVLCVSVNVVAIYNQGLPWGNWYRQYVDFTCATTHVPGVQLDCCCNQINAPFEIGRLIGDGGGTGRAYFKLLLVVEDFSTKV